MDFLTNISDRQNTLITLLELKCKELDFILSEVNNTDDKQNSLKALGTSVNSTLKLILKEEKNIYKAIEKLSQCSLKPVIPKPDFYDEFPSCDETPSYNKSPSCNKSPSEIFDNWNPEIEYPKEISYKRVYEIPNNCHQ